MNTVILQYARQTLKSQQKSCRTEQAYMDWIYRFLLFHQKTDATTFAFQHLKDFLHFLIQERKVSSATHNQALQALSFFYKKVLNQPLDHVADYRINSKFALPDVLQRSEIKALFEQLKGEAFLMIALLYGCGLRLEECLSIRIRDIDMKNKVLTIKGTSKNRLVQLPNALYDTLRNRLQLLQLQYNDWMREGFPGVVLPEAVEKRDPQAAWKWHWQYLFPAQRPAQDGRFGKLKWHHRSHSFLEKAIKEAAGKAQLSKNISCHIFRHSCAVHLLENGYDINLVQKLLGHTTLRSTMIYKKIATPKAILHSPLDELQ